MPGTSEDFQLEWHGGTVVVSPASNVENMRWDLIEQAAEVVMEPMKRSQVPGLIDRNR